MNGTEERRATSLRLTVAQLKWIKDRAFERRCSQQDVIETALTAAGAPVAVTPREGGR